MVQEYDCYKILPVGKNLSKTFPMKEVKSGTIVKVLEPEPRGLLNKVKVLLPTGKIKKVYEFQLEKAKRLNHETI